MLNPTRIPDPLATATVSEIITHILATYHDPWRRDFPRLVALARDLEDPTHGHRTFPRDLAEHLALIRDSMTSHLEKEEKILFPLLTMGRGGMAKMAIKAMMAEHEDHHATLRRMRSLTHDFALPADATLSWKILYRELQDFERALGEHIHIENDVLFPRALCEEF